MGTKTQKLSNVVDQIVEWQSVIVADGSTNTTAVAGRGYFIDTSAGAHTINLPASPKIGDVIELSCITSGNSITVGRNGNNINGSTNNITFDTDGDSYKLVYVNVSEGWKVVNEKSTLLYVTATGGTVTESTDYKIHTFTGDGCFVVSCAGNAAGSNTVDYLVVAGGGAGGTYVNDSYPGGGGGAGGYRESSGAASGCYTRSPLGACVAALSVSATTYPVTVGGSGGSGGGSSYNSGRGLGNTPPVSPPQGNNGGDNTGAPTYETGGGGGATAVGGAPGSANGAGGAGGTTSISASSTTYAGGGGGGGHSAGTGNGAPGGSGGGGAGAPWCGPKNGAAGTANTGGGGGGAARESGVATGNGGAGGKGIVIIRYKFQ